MVREYATASGAIFKSACPVAGGVMGPNAWEASAYDDNHSFVYEYGADLVGLLSPGREEYVLDLGCGTGHLAARIAESGATVVGLDRSFEMLSRARREHPGLLFLRGDARALPFEGVFDAVFSNATLHWIDDQDAVIASVRDSLRSGGRFAAELGSTGNVEGIVQAVEAELESRGYGTSSPWYFPSLEEYTARLERHGFEVQYARVFDRPTELDGGERGLRNWLELFGDTFFESVPESRMDDVVGSIEDRLGPTHFRNGTWIADYRRLRFVARTT